MQNVNYVDIEFILEKLNEDTNHMFIFTEAVIKDRIYEAIRKIGTLELLDIYKEEFTLKNNNLKIPAYINNIQTIKSIKGKNFTQVRSNFDYYTSKPVYLIRGKNIRFPKGTEKVIIEYFGLPRDEKGRPLILDNTYVISAVKAFLIFKEARRLWMSNRLALAVYRELEQEWLFYVSAAQEDTSMPTDDEMRELDAVFTTFPLGRLYEDN